MNHELLNPGLFNPKSGFEKSGVGKFINEKNRVEKFGVEKSRVEMSFNLEKWVQSNPPTCFKKKYNRVECNLFY